jgi:hypothetical protein
MSAQEIHDLEQAARRDARIRGFMVKGMGLQDAESAVNAEDIRVENLKRTHRNGEATHVPQPTAPQVSFTGKETDNLLTIQAFQLKHGHTLGLYAKNSTTSRDGAYGLEDYAISDYRLPIGFNRLLPTRLAEQVDTLEQAVDGEAKSPNITDSVQSAPFNALTLTLCETNASFKQAFALAYSTNQNNERFAFIAAFRETPNFLANDEFIQKIRAHADSKPHQVKMNGGLVDSPKKAFLNNLITALTAETANKDAAAGNLFDSGNNDRLRKNTGFIGWLRNLFGAQTKTMKFATTFFNHQPAQATVNVENPLNAVTE